MKNLCRLLAIAILFFAAPVLAAPLVIGGTIVTPQGPRPHAWLVVEGGKIAAISDSKPAIAGAKVLQTDELVFPGFVDLHNHPLWAVFPRFAPKPPPAAAPWPNRYAWRSDARYHKALQDPWWDMMSHGAFCALDEYAELQALIGGTTSILGLDLVDENAPPPGCIRGLARNLDYYTGFYGSQTGQERVAWVLGVFSDMHYPAARMLHDRLDAGKLDAMVVHTAEGRRDDAESRAEFTMLKSWGLLGPHTAVVHGVALSADDYAAMAKAGASLIWSPRSNLELYHQTADLKDAVKAKLQIALAPDWAPTGSPNMLGEIAYADALKTDFSQKQLFEMATATPARIARLDGKIGTLVAGHYADLFLLHGDGRDPYRALAHAKPQDVTLTMVGGEPLYGAAANLKALGAVTEDMDVCGEKRAFNSAALPMSFAKLRETLTAKLKTYGIALAPLVYCAP
jgi:cytosine/adenosine deaminase-related metal-dependent hydrolase